MRSKACLLAMLVFLTPAVGGCSANCSADGISLDRDEIVDKHRDYESAIRQARTELDALREFVTTYPSAIAYVSGYGSPDAVEKTCIAVTTLHDRYELTMRVPVRTSDGTILPSNSGSRHFTLRELIEVTPREHGVLDIGIGEYREFEDDVWRQIRDQGGRIDRVFPEIKTDSPVPNFDRYIEHLRESAPTVIRSAD